MNKDEKIPKIALFHCSGCMANVGALTVSTSLEAFRRLQNEDVGLFCLSAIANEVPKHRKTTENAETLVSIDRCLAGLSTNVAPVIWKTKVAKKVITVDGCPMEYSRKIVEEAGFRIAESVVLVRDIGMKKKALHEDIGKELKQVMEYISLEDVERAKELIIKAVIEKP